MQQSPTTKEQRPVWFVGAAFGGIDDQADRFLQDGIWENGYKDRYIDDVKSIEVGDRIAIKASFTRKSELGFDSRGHSVSGMKIKAVGVVTQNMADGRHLKVAWERVDPPREWLFYTYRRTVWRVQHGSGSLPQAAAALIRFTFEGDDQDVDWFRNLPSWKSQFGDEPSDGQRFSWTKFYSSVADRLLPHRRDRSPLLSAILDSIDRLQIPFPTQDRYRDGTRRRMEDICPFTAIGCFNRRIKDENRRSLATELSKILRVDETTPMLTDDRDGIPLLDNRNSWYFGYEKDRGPDDIESLWQVFSDCVRVADEDGEDVRSRFERSYDRALSLKRVGIAKLTMGLFWVRPWSFPTLESNSIEYIKTDLREAIPDRYTPTGAEYLELRDRLLERFEDRTIQYIPFLSFR